MSEDSNSVQSQCEPQKHQKNRSSNNFSIDPPKSAESLLWSTNPTGITFNVMEDKGSLHHDQTVFTGVTDGTVTPVPPTGKKYYIADPSGCASKSDNFTATWTSQKTPPS